MIKKITFYFINGTTLNVDGSEFLRVDPQIGAVMLKDNHGDDIVVLIAALRYWIATPKQQELVTQ